MSDDLPTEDNPTYLLIAPSVRESARIIADFVHACTLLDLNVATRNVYQGAGYDHEDEVVTHIRAAAW